MAGAFPGAGKKFLVDFQAFKVLLDFTDEHSLTYYSYREDGSVGEQETVSIETEQIAGNIYLVRWQESDKTTVVHVEDYDQRTIVTNITSPNLSFLQFHGTFIDAPPEEHPG